jgi:hypothetical protein
MIPSYWTGEKSAEIYMSWAVYRTIFRITGGFRSKFYCHRQVSESRNKLFEEGNWKDF